MKNNTTKNARNRGGFSLLELMLVLAIIGVLTAIAAVSLSGSGNRAKDRATRASMNTIRGALRNYQLDNNTYPSSLAVLTVGKSAYLSSDYKLADGWGQAFLYSVPGNNHDFELISKGADGIFPSADDISVWNLDTAPGQ